MCDDVIIGKGNSGCSSTQLLNIGTLDIAQNGVCYWISGAILGCGGIIFKDTKEGKKLTALIAKKYDKKIVDFIDKIILANIDVEKLRLKIKNELEDARRQGKEEKIKEILKVLNIDQSWS